MLRARLLAIASAAVLISPQALAVEYSAESIEARVVDAQTQSPLEGVIVVAHWQLEGGLEGGNVLGQVKVVETVTDASGVFRFPAWGPVPIPRGLPANARLKDLDPEIILFKPGYKFVHLKNTRTFEQTRGFTPYVRTSDWNGKTIKMNTLSADIDETAKDLWAVESFIGFTKSSYSPCAWTSIPKMIQLLHKSEVELEATARHLPAAASDYRSLVAAASTYEYLLANETYFLKLDCGSPKQIISEVPR